MGGRFLPILALLLLAGALAGAVVATTRGADRSVKPAAPAPARNGTFRPRPATTSTEQTTAQATTPATMPLELSLAGKPLVANSHFVRLAGKRARARRVRVLDVVGRKIFWIAAGNGGRVLVHYQGIGTMRAIRPGEHLTFDAVVKRNRPGAPAAWGLTVREGRPRLHHQGAHLETYGPSITFRR